MLAKPPRRGPLAVLAVIGLALVAAPFAFGMFSRAPKGARMIAGFAPYMTNHRLDGFQSDLRYIDGGVLGGQAAVSVLGGGGQAAVHFPQFVTFERRWRTIDPNMTSMLDTIQANVDNYRAVAALPTFRLFPWFFVIPGAIVLLLVGLVWFRAAAGRSRSGSARVAGRRSDGSWRSWVSGSCSPRSPFGCSRGRRRARLFPPDFALDGDALRAAITPRAKVLLLNSPHNPTGRVLSRAELETIATACIEHDLICVSDEVYEILGYEGEHLPPATLPGMAERTLTISSVGKSFSFTGWKIGWCSGPAELVEATRTVKPYLTFAGGTQLQHAAAAALRLPAQFVNCQRDELRARRDQLCTALATAGVQPFTPQGTYFVNADVGEDAVAFCLRLPERCGVVAIPTPAFYDDQAAAGTLVRFAFCKRESVISEAARRLATLSA